MRGKVLLPNAAATQLGITPACAGKSPPLVVIWLWIRDHPRLCGEKPLSPFGTPSARGSPPPMRGKVADIFRQQVAARITPAYAGKRTQRGSGVVYAEDHPRLCGEKGRRGGGFTRAWRITPAYAGKSAAQDGQQLGCEDHPRLCGEKKVQHHATPKFAGSPPPMRGKELRFGLRFRLRRITPAYAGKRVSNGRRAARKRDHPRLCGEKFKNRGSINHTQGSPPPMRGKEFGKLLDNPVDGITPAYAGKSQHDGHRKNQRRDHPRLCGEKSACWWIKNSSRGSPPPMRGKDLFRP